MSPVQMLLIIHAAANGPVVCSSGFSAECKMSYFLILQAPEQIQSHGRKSSKDFDRDPRRHPRLQGVARGSLVAGLTTGETVAEANTCAFLSAFCMFPRWRLVRTA